MASSVGLAKGPACRGNIVGDYGAAIAGDYSEGEALAIEVGVALPVLAPVPWHRLPGSSWTLDGNSMDIAGAPHVGDEDKIEVGMAIDGEPDASWFSAGNPTKPMKEEALWARQ